jgi:hypothetical protein
MATKWQSSALISIPKESHFVISSRGYVGFHSIIGCMYKLTTQQTKLIFNNTLALIHLFIRPVRLWYEPDFE